MYTTEVACYNKVWAIATLVGALSRSGVGDVITDFSVELDEIEAPTPEIL